MIGLRPFFGPPEARVFRLSQWRAGCAIVIQQHAKRPIGNRTMRPFFVVVFAPILHLFLRVCNAHEPVDVQAFDPEATVEGLDEGIIGLLARPGEVKRDTALVGPKI